MLAVTCLHPEEATQVLGRTVVVLPVVLSFSVAVAQSWLTVSGQVTLYQKDSWLLPVGAVKVCLIDDAPLVGDVEPSSAAYVPLWGPDVVTPVAGPLAVQPDRVPVSKPPLTIPPGLVTVRV